MNFDVEIIEKLKKEYDLPVYVFDRDEFVNNYHHLENCFKSIYPKYQISYSFKTNYTPYIVKTVKSLGGYAEVVSGMEYHIAKKLGYRDEEILFNGPDKGDEGIEAFLNGSMIHVDNMQEAIKLCEAAHSHTERQFKVAIRVNADIGQNFVSRFGFDDCELDEVFELFGRSENIKVSALHCHISRCRGLDKWKERAEKMLKLADKYFVQEYPEYIDLGSGMFGSMDPEFAAQFDDVPTYEEYAECVAGLFAEHYNNVTYDKKPFLITEPGTTLINKFVYFIGKVDAIKKIRNKWFAVLNCSEHNLGETCLLKELPMKILNRSEGQEYQNMDFTGYTCLEQDVMRKNVNCRISVGDYVVFGNVGGYSNVLKPPFIWPNCAMVTINGDKVELIKKKESYDDVLSTYIF